MYSCDILVAVMPGLQPTSDDRIVAATMVINGGDCFVGKKPPPRNDANYALENYLRLRCLIKHPTLGMVRRIASRSPSHR